MLSRKRVTLAIVIALTIILSLGVGAFAYFSGGGNQTEREVASVEEETTGFEPARVEPVAQAKPATPAVEETPAVAEVAPKEEAPPALPEEEQLSEEALQLAFEIEQLKQQQNQIGQKKIGKEDAEFSEEDYKDKVKVTIQSNPPAKIIIDGEETDYTTPKTFPLDPGKYDVSVRYDNKKLSEKKVIQARKGSNVKLNFRQPVSERDDKSKIEALAKKRKVRTLKPALLVLVTNFDKADITVNGLPYPEYFEDPEDEGMLLPAGGPYDVRVSYDGKTKEYDISLRPYEARYLVVELTGFKGSTAPAPARPAVAKPTPKKEEPKEEKKEDEGSGKVTVYSKPRGDIMLDGKDAGKRTPNTIDAEEGRHEVQVRYESGEVSEPKIVRVRKGSRIKLFFREPAK